MRAVRNTSDGIQVLDVAPPDGADLLDPVVVNPLALISHRFELERAADAFDTAGDRAARAIKVVVDVS